MTHICAHTSQRFVSMSIILTNTFFVPFNQIPNKPRVCIFSSLSNRCENTLSLVPTVLIVTLYTCPYIWIVHKEYLIWLCVITSNAAKYREAGRIIDCRQSAVIFSNTLEPVNLSRHASALETSGEKLCSNSTLYYHIRYMRNLMASTMTGTHSITCTVSAWSLVR